MNHNFLEIKEKTFEIYSLGKGHIGLDFFSRYDSEFQESEVFNNFIIDKKRKENFSVYKVYLTFIQNKFIELSLNEQVELILIPFKNNLNFYKAHKMHAIVDNFRGDMINSNLEILFNGNYYADILLVIGNHFQEPIDEKSIRSELKKEIPKALKKDETFEIFQNNCYFKNSKCIDSIFKIKELKLKIEDIKKKHNIK